MAGRTGKRLFLGLVLLTGALFGGGGLLLWWLPRASPRIQLGLPSVLGAIMAAVSLGIAAGVAILVFAILFERDLPGTRRLRGILVRGLFPPMVGVARLLGIPREKVERSFIAVNNQLVYRSGLHAAPERFLILLPHCLQVDSCPVRITAEIQNCRRCGACPIAGLVDVGTQFGIHLSVATGGTIARRIIVEQKPQAIIAVACERDLTSGIQDAYPLPVYGILNERPNGPCFNTSVDLAEMERALRGLLGLAATGRTGDEAARKTLTARKSVG